MIKNCIVFYLIVFIPWKSPGQIDYNHMHDSYANSDPNSTYLNWLKSYWNYRYHLLGDGNIKSQHFPSDCDFMQPSGIGEPGMIVVGTGAPGLSLIADNIQTYKQAGPPTALTLSGNPNGVLAGAPFQGFDGTQLPVVCNQSNMTPLGWTATTWTNINLDGAFQPFGLCSNVAALIDALPVQPVDPGGIVNFSTETPHSFAMYLEILATEWELLYINHQNTSKTENELYDALQALIRIDNYTKVQFFPNESLNNGFFYRDDVPPDLALGPIVGGAYTYQNFGPNRLISSLVSCDQNFSCTGLGANATAYKGEESQDVLYPILLSLRTVTELVANQTRTGTAPSAFETLIRQIAKDEAIAMIDWARNKNKGWIIRNPGNDGESDGVAICAGASASSYSFLMDIVEKKMGGSIPLSDPVAESIGEISWLFDFRPTCNTQATSTYYYGGQSQALWFADELAVAGDAFGKKKGAGKEALRDFNNYAHANGNSNNCELSDDHINIQLDLLNSILNGRDVYSDHTVFEQILSRSTLYPCFPQPTFSSASLEEHTYTSWMLLFNLYSLAFSSNVPLYSDLAQSSTNKYFYTNLQERYVSTSFPITVSGATIGNATNPIDIQASDSMILKGANTNTGAYVNFIAPHIFALPSVNGQPSTTLLSNCTLQPRRMDCSLQELIVGGTSTDPFLISRQPDDEADDDNIYDIPISLDSVQYLLTATKRLLEQDDFPYEVKQEIYQELHKINAYYDNTLFNLNDIAGEFAIDGNKMAFTAYPNPFSTICTVCFNLPSTTNVSIALFDLAGRKVNSIAENILENVGEHKMEFDRGNLSRGIYLLQFADSNGNMLSQKLVIE